MPIYTRTGDSGSTGLLGGGRVGKTDARIDACGAFDELNSILGLARALGCDVTIDAELAKVQADLFAVGAELADPSGRMCVWTGCRSAVGTLEARIDAWEAAMPPLRSFVLPGGSPGGAALHVARAVARRAERALVSLSQMTSVRPDLLAYCNRLSDYLFVAARAVNSIACIPEARWTPDAPPTQVTP